MKTSLVCLLILAMKVKSGGGTVIDSDRSDDDREVEGLARGGDQELMPTAVALIKKDDISKQVFCSGTIIAVDKILTAAHCLKEGEGESDVKNIRVVAGEGDLIAKKTGVKSKAKEFDVKKALIHPHYNPETNGNRVWDIAIIELTEAMDIETNPYLMIATLPPPEIPVLGREIKVGGWGKTTQYNEGSPVHNVIQVKIEPHEVCEASFGKDQYISENMFCAGKRMTTVCEGGGAGAALSDARNCQSSRSSRSSPAGSDPGLGLAGGSGRSPATRWG